MRNRQLEGLALAALRQAVRLLSLAIGTRIGELRESGDRFLATAGRLEEQALLVRLHEELRDVVAARWDKIPSRERPHYTPEQRYRILRVKELLALSRKEIARRVRVDPDTIANWEAEVREARPGGTTVGSTVKPEPPVRRFADVVRATVQAMALAGFGGDETIARTLARAGWKLSKRTVGRVRREKPVAPPIRPTSPRQGSTGGTVTARHPNHVRMMDLTEVPGLFRIVLFRLVVSFDVFSRMPLAGRVTSGEPSAQVILDVAQAA